MVLKKYISEEAIRKEFIISELPSHTIAIENSIWLKKQMASKLQSTPFYELNPYTDIYRLVFRLLSFPKNFIWFNNNEEFKHNDFIFKVTRQCSIISIKMVNQKGIAYIVNSDSFGLLDVEGNAYAIGNRKVLCPKEEFFINYDLTSSLSSAPVFFYYKISDLDYFVSDL
jgi:hypothetical protein